MFPAINKARVPLFVLLFASAQVWAQKATAPNWRINAGIGYGTYFGDVSRYRIQNGSDWRNVKYFLAYNKNYVQRPSYHLALEKKLSNSSGILFSGNYTSIAMSDRYLTNDGKLLTNNTNFARALNFSSKIYDLGISYKLKSNEQAFLAPYLWLGGGLSFFSTFGDLYDSAGKAYNYASQAVAINGTYETNLRNSLTETDAKYRNKAPYANVGLGLAVKLSRVVAIGIETDIKYLFSDYLDDVSGTYKATYATPQQAYAAKPGTNTINPANPVRGNNDGVNDFYIQNRVVIKYNFYAALKKRNASRKLFNAPIIYPEYGNGLARPDTLKNVARVDSFSTDTVLKTNTQRQLNGVDSLLYDQKGQIKDLAITVYSLQMRLDSLDKKFLQTEQRDRATMVNKKLDSVQQLLNAVERKPRKTTADSLRMRVYQLQADSIRNEAAKNGIEVSRLHKINTGRNFVENLSLAEGDTTQVVPVTNVRLQQKNQPDSVRLSNKPSDELVMNKRADSLQNRLDSFLQLQQRTKTEVSKTRLDSALAKQDTVVITRIVTVKDTIAQKRIAALNTTMQRLYNTNDSLKGTLSYLNQLRDATQVQMSNDSLRLQALRQQLIDEPPTEERQRKWYEVLKKKDERSTNASRDRDETALQITTLERELNDLKNRNASIERQMQVAPRTTERYYEPTFRNSADQRRYSEVADELQELNRQLGRERRYVPQQSVVVSPQADTSNLQQEIALLRADLQALKQNNIQNTQPPVADTVVTKPDSSMAKLNDVTRMLDSLNQQLAALKKATENQPTEKANASAISVYFNNGSVVATAAQRGKLMALRNSMKEKTNFTVALKAYTDATGNVNVNEALSQKRALYVKNYLLQQLGIPSENVSIELFPSSRQAGGVPNPLDRRVDVILTPTPL